MLFYDSEVLSTEQEKDRDGMIGTILDNSYERQDGTKVKSDKHEESERNARDAFNSYYYQGLQLGYTSAGSIQICRR